MDGKGRAIDNIFIERLWRTIKYENIFICGDVSLLEAEEGLREYLIFYNEVRIHKSLGYRTPAQVYTGSEVVECIIVGKYPLYLATRQNKPTPTRSPLT